MKYLRNHSGLTLIELLASLALLSIVITIGGSLLMQGFLSSSKVHNEINVNQQANLILSILREEASEKSVNICLLSNGDLLMDGKSLMTKEQLTIHELYIETINSSPPNLNGPSSKTPQDDENSKKCYRTSLTQPTYIRLSLGIEGESATHITSTIISKRPVYRADPSQDPEEGDSDDVIEYNIFTTLEEFETITPENISDFNLDFPDGSENYCELTGNIKLKSNKVFAPTWGTECPRSTFLGHVWEPYPFSVFSEISVEAGFYLDQGATFEKYGSLFVKGNGYIADATTIKAQAKLHFNNGYIKDRLTIQENASLTTNGSLRVDGAVLLTGSGSIKSGGYMFLLGSATIQENASLTTNGNLQVDGQVVLKGSGSIQTEGDIFLQAPVSMQSNTSLTSKKTMTFNDSVDLESNGAIASEEALVFNGEVSTQNSVQIVSGGDITFNEEVSPDWSTAFICAEGDIYGIENIEKNHRIKANQPEGTCIP